LYESAARVDTREKRRSGLDPDRRVLL